MVTTKETKHSFSVNGEPLSQESLVGTLRADSKRFPHVNGGPLNVVGQLGESGVLVTHTNGLVYGSVRHTSFIPSAISGKEITYGGPQTSNHIERSFLVNESSEFVGRHAKGMLYILLQPHSSLKELSRFYEGAGAGGSEPEAWLIDQNGEPYRIPDGGELQNNLCEDTLGAIADPYEFVHDRAIQILERNIRYPDATIVDTSSMPTGLPTDMQIQSSGDIGPYVQAIQNILYSRFMHCYHPAARSLMNSIAQASHFNDWQDMHSSLGDMAYLSFSASHLSIGLPHIRNGNEAVAIPELEAIAVADIFNSNLATLAELLMFSTPMVYGITPTVNVNGTNLWPRDMRTIMRYALDTTYPAPFIKTPEQYRNNVTHQIVNGLSHTLDRAAYMTEITDQENDRNVQRAVMHGRVRIRAASNEPKNLSGRVEFTGCSASPSLHDEVARNCFLQLLMIAAYESLANGVHPAEYFKLEFPNIADWSQQQDLAIEASLYGFHAPRIKALIAEGIKFIDCMEHKFRQNNQTSSLTPQAVIARTRLHNLLNPPSTSLDAYLHNPVGPFSEVVQHELAKHSPLKVTQRIEEYQLNLAKKFLSPRGF
jgi:hypothetical protein